MRTFAPLSQCYYGVALQLTPIIPKLRQQTLWIGREARGPREVQEGRSRQQLQVRS